MTDLILFWWEKTVTVRGLSWLKQPKTRAITEYHGRPVGNGVIVLQEGADDCVISGLTVYNNYGTAVENTTIHQMATFWTCHSYYHHQQ